MRYIITENDIVVLNEIRILRFCDALSIFSLIIQTNVGSGPQAGMSKDFGTAGSWQSAAVQVRSSAWFKIKFYLFSV